MVSVTATELEPTTIQFINEHSTIWLIEEPRDISSISNNPFIPSIGNNLNTSTNQNNEKRHLLPESTPNLPPNLNNKTPAKSKSIQELESFIDRKYNELALGSLKRDAEIKQQISQELETH